MPQLSLSVTVCRIGSIEPLTGEAVNFEAGPLDMRAMLAVAVKIKKIIGRRGSRSNRNSSEIGEKGAALTADANLNCDKLGR